MARVASDLSFRLMALEFRLRDILQPPKAVLVEAGVKPGDCVLDFGCGPGGFTVAAAAIVGQTGRVYALDVHPLAIANVRKAIARRGLGNVHTIQSDGPTGLGDASVDVALLYDVFHDLTQPEAALREIHRVLKPDGVLSFTDHHMTEGQIVAAVTSEDLFSLSGKGRTTHRFAKRD